ncbi:MAG TPA: hypothetical protein PKZ82_06110, partial [Microthrixaceae bacterium]|nr:hypothetical protein [Microthrixaceae bacterium]
LDVVNGELRRLDLTVNASFEVAKAKVTATDLRFTYVTDTNRFTLSGTAGVEIQRLGTLSVTFGYTNPVTHVTTPGIDVVDGDA